MALINVPDIQNLDAATPELWNSRFGTIANEINGNLDSANLSNGAVTAGKLATDSVTTGKIADGNVTPPKWTLPYKFSVYRATAITLSAASYTLIPYDTKLFDTSSNVDVATNKGRFTAPVNGFYWFYSSTNTATSNYILPALYKNGTLLLNGDDITSGAGSMAGAVGGLVQLIAGDYIEVFVNAGAAAVALNTGSTTSYFMGWLVSQT